MYWTNYSNWGGCVQ